MDEHGSKRKKRNMTDLSVSKNSSILDEKKWDRAFHYAYFDGGHCRIWKADFGPDIRWAFELYAEKFEMCGSSESFCDAKSDIERWIRILRQFGGKK
jgi:hypothetical protein